MRSSSETDALLIGVADVVPPNRGGSPSPVELMAEASRRAVKDAGFSLSDIDGLAVSSVDHYMPTLTLGAHLGLRPLFVDSTSLGGSSSVAQLDHAIAAIETGRCSVALIVFGSTIRSDPSTAHRMSELSNYETPYGYPYPLGGFALMAARHMHVYGTTPEQLANVAVAARAWSALTPGAERRERLTVADVLASPYVVEPLHRLDCCLVSNGAIALVVTRRDRARDRVQRGVRVAGIAQAQSHRHIVEMAELLDTPTRISGRCALDEAGLTVGDIDIFELYDAATITVLLALEDLGLCKKGEGGSFFAATSFAPGSGRALNTNGGGLAYRHPGMLGLYLIGEAVLQLQGRAGERQVPGAATALVSALGGVYGASGTAVLLAEDLS